MVCRERLHGVPSARGAKASAASRPRGQSVFRADTALQALGIMGAICSHPTFLDETLAATGVVYVPLIFLIYLLCLLR